MAQSASLIQNTECTTARTAWWLATAAHLGVAVPPALKLRGAPTPAAATQRVRDTPTYTHAEFR
jgi:hypothetical protein